MPKALKPETPPVSETCPDADPSVRLKLAAELGRGQTGSVFVFDEPSVGLHPLDIRTLLAVIQRLDDSGATVIVIEHDLDMIANADYVIDLGPGGGAAGGRIVAAGTPAALARAAGSVTGRYLAGHVTAGGPGSGRTAAS